MGFYFRKSVRFGPFRLNFSKSGIGVSAGVKGARVSTGPRGTYVHAGKHGFYYSQRIDQPPLTPKQNSPPRWVNQQPALPSDAFVIETADINQLTETSIKELLQEINERAAQPRFAPWAIAGTVLCMIVTGLVASAVTVALSDMGNGDRNSAQSVATFVAIVATTAIGAFGSFLSWRIHKGDELKRTTPLFYELNDEVITKFGKVRDACVALSRSARIWRVHTNQPTWDWKRNAGASNLITRQPVFVGLMPPPYIATNVDVWSIRLNDLNLFFMPDYVFVRQQGRYGAVSYESFSATSSLTRFIEDGAVPPDAQIVDYTWQFVNKKGGPDRRFSNNRQLPVAQYSFVQIQSTTGLNLHLHVSSSTAANAFVGVFFKGRAKTERSNGRYEKSGKRDHAPSIDPKIRAALKALGLSPSASSEEIVSAYRSMAKMYHPDRLANLAPEFIELAETRMKEINAAYEVLKKQQSRT
jgi:Protein of unknown function (DUF4236)/DnaJ domain